MKLKFRKKRERWFFISLKTTNIKRKKIMFHQLNIKYRLENLSASYLFSIIWF